MYEFDSVSVSAFEAAELAAILTAKSADGWDVAGIVTAGSDVVAYLRRGSGAETAKEDDTSSGDAAASEAQPVSTLSTESTSAAEPAVAEPVAASSSANDLLAGGATAATPSDSGGTGWGASTDTSSSPSGGWGTSDTSSSGSSWGGSAQQASVPAAQTTPSVPAGWYADPAGRYELRYWDGGAWTEHVSRAGQQYTDPPVA